jgi:hypothetical protein
MVKAFFPERSGYVLACWKVCGGGAKFGDVKSKHIFQLIGRNASALFYIRAGDWISGAG